MNKLVSVIIATYNMRQYLESAVRSALSQSYTNVEVIVIDDGSTDGTNKIMENLKGEPRLKYFYQNNRGQSSAQNKGIRESKGDYIAFLDADDVWMQQKLDKEMPLFEGNNNIGVVYSDVIFMDANGKPFPTRPNKRYYAGRITERLFIDNFINVNSAVIKKECFDAVGLLDESLTHGLDWDLWLRISTQYEFAFLNEPTFYYRIWPGQISRNYLKRFECTIRIMEKFLKENPGLLPKKIIKEAWADTFVNHGYFRLSEKEKKLALKYFLLALKARPVYIPALKGLAKLLLG